MEMSELTKRWIATKLPWRLAPVVPPALLDEELLSLHAQEIRHRMARGELDANGFTPAGGVRERTWAETYAELLGEARLLQGEYRDWYMQAAGYALGKAHIVAKTGLEPGLMPPVHPAAELASLCRYGPARVGHWAEEMEEEPAAAGKLAKEAAGEAI
jgi:hypothetical protein